MSTNAAFRSPGGTMSWLHWDGYPEAVLPALAALVDHEGPEAGLAALLEYDWETLLDEPTDEPVRMLPPGTDLSTWHVRWIYDVDQHGVTVTHPCADAECPNYGYGPERVLWTDLAKEPRP